MNSFTRILHLVRFDWSNSEPTEPDAAEDSYSWDDPYFGSGAWDDENGVMR